MATMLIAVVQLHIDGVVDAGDGPGIGAGAIAAAEELEGHHFGVPAHAGHADAVVAHGGDGPRGVGAVAAVVQRVGRRPRRR